MLPLSRSLNTTVKIRQSDMLSTFRNQCASDATTLQVLREAVVRRSTCNDSFSFAPGGGTSSLPHLSKSACSSMEMISTSARTVT